MIINIINSIDALFCTFLLFKFFKMKMNHHFAIFTIITAFLFCFFNDFSLIISFFLISIIYFRFILNKELNNIFLFALLSIAMFIASDLIKKSMLPWIYPYYNNYYERMIIHFFLTIFSVKVICPKTYYLNNQIITSISFGILSLLFIALYFAKIALGNTLSNIEIFIGSLATLFMGYFLLQYLLLFNESSIQLLFYQNKQNNYKYNIFNQTKLINAYEKSNKMNHNIKYILLNLKRLINNHNEEDALNYIEDNLNMVKDNQSVFTNNPFFDYTINYFHDELKKLGIVCNKNIFLNENSYFNQTIFADKITQFFKDQMSYVDVLNPESISLIIQEKGDFLSIKTIYYDIQNTTIDTSYHYSINDHILIMTMTLNKNDFN